MSKREEVVPRYKFTLPLIHYVVEHEAATYGIKISRGVKPVLVNKQKI
jgi:hypothetical protein